MGDNNALILYTWRDIEMRLYLNKNRWPEEWIDIEVFSDELLIYVKSQKDVMGQTAYFLNEVFRQYYLEEENRISIDVTDTLLEVRVEEAPELEPAKTVQTYPLFKDFLYVEKEVATNLKVLETPVCVFHSYKGGVGRTLSLITFVKETMEKYGDKKKFLIIDSDMEAPGLTRLGKEQNGFPQISYLDILSIINAKGLIPDMLNKISTVIEQSSLIFKTEKMELPHYFLPTYRYEEQIMDIYANPERIMVCEENKYIIVDYLSALGKALQVDMVLVDLRAGISEYSAPFLYDPRVNKFLVTSSSWQSIYGTNFLMKQLKKQKDNQFTNIILTMVKEEEPFAEKEIMEIYDLLFDGMEEKAGEDLSDDISSLDRIKMFWFRSELVQLKGLDDICERLSAAGRAVKDIRSMVEELFDRETAAEELIYKADRVNAFRRNLNEIARSNITAEGTGAADLLTTRPIMQLGAFYSETPRINILGAKGSGKTYLYKQLLKAKNWSDFLILLGKLQLMREDVLICPLLSSDSRAKIQPLLTEAIRNCREGLPELKQDYSLSENEERIKQAIDSGFTSTRWLELWSNLILNMFDYEMQTLQELNAYLVSRNKRILFLVDGLEDIFKDVGASRAEKDGIAALCKGLINSLNEKRIDRVGIITFIRKDIADLAIQPNFEQFRNQYRQFELDWSQTEALRLAMKLSDRAAQKTGFKLYELPVSIVNLSRNVINEELCRLWGRKMGPDSSKTAGTVRWVLASLSDFTGQLQPRDIVRFLEYSSENNMSSESRYGDRFLFPDDMRQAIKDCSREKLDEVVKEIQQLKGIFEKLKDVNRGDKQVPLKDEVLNLLDTEERKTLERYGYLRESGGSYYIPECIRYALEYNKTKRGGIKVVSLLVNK